jgi:hypothetical protein
MFQAEIVKNNQNDVGFLESTQDRQVQPRAALLA